MRTALSSDEKEISSYVIWSFKRDLRSVLKLAQICQDTKITNKHLRSKYISSTSSTSKTPLTVYPYVFSTCSQIRLHQLCFVSDSLKRISS